jgi:hypothetical protein
VSEPLPGGWAPSTDLFGSQWTTLPQPTRDSAAQLAVRMLWALSGRQFGTRTIRLAPYVPWPRQGYFRGGWRRGSYSPLSTVGGGVSFEPWLMPGCGRFVAFRLPGRAVSVTRVTIDGADLPTSAWTLDPDGVLVRTDGEAWRYAQNVYQPTWTVEYVEGVVPDPAANAAAGRLALEIGKAMVADPATRLHPRTRDVVRGGTSLTLTDPSDLANAGLTGIPPVDRWIRTVNPKGQQEMSTLSGMNTARHRVLS